MLRRYTSLGLPLFFKFGHTSFDVGQFLFETCRILLETIHLILIGCPAPIWRRSGPLTTPGLSSPARCSSSVIAVPPASSSAPTEHIAPPTAVARASTSSAARPHTSSAHRSKSHGTCFVSSWHNCTSFSHDDSTKPPFSYQDHLHSNIQR